MDIDNMTPQDEIEMRLRSLEHVVFNQIFTIDGKSPAEELILDALQHITMILELMKYKV